MATAGTLLTRASRQLLSGTVEERNKLAATVTSSDTTLTFTYDVGGIRPGAVIELESELCYVWEATTSTKTAVVERGYLGSTAAAHTSGTAVTVNPRFPRSQMLDALNADIDDLSSTMNGLFRVVAVNVDYNGSDRQINVTSATSIIELMDVRLRYMEDDFPFVRGVRLQRDMPTADFASGFSVVLDDAVMAGTLRIRYKAPFVRAASESSDITSYCYVPATCEDILEMGVAIRMMGAREVKRNFIESQSDTRRPEEVPPRAISESISNLQRMRRDRITAEAARLKAQYPQQFRR